MPTKEQREHILNGIKSDYEKLRERDATRPPVKTEKLPPEKLPYRRDQKIELVRKHCIAWCRKKAETGAPEFAGGVGRRGADWAAVSEFDYYLGHDEYVKIWNEEHEKVKAAGGPASVQAKPETKKSEPKVAEEKKLEPVMPKFVPKIPEIDPVGSKSHVQQRTAPTPAVYKPEAMSETVSYVILPEKKPGKTARIHVKLDGVSMDRMKTGASRRSMDDTDYIRGCIEAVFSHCDEKNNTYLGKPFRGYIVDFLKEDRNLHSASDAGDLYVRIDPAVNKKLKAVSQRSGIMISDFVRFCLWEVEHHE